MKNNGSNCSGNVWNGATISSAGYISGNSFYINSGWITVPSEESFIEEPGKEKQIKVKQGNLEGYNCKCCNEFSPMAELNLPINGDEKFEFACYSCRNNLK